MITVYALKFWQRFKNHPFRSRFEQALKPITVGLVLVSAWMIAHASAQNTILVMIVILTTLLGLFKRIHPLWVMLLGAGLGIVLL